MADVSLTARADQAWVVEGAQDGVEGEVYVFTLTVPYATTISTPDHFAYRNKTDVTSAVGWTCAPAASGNVFTALAMTPTADIAGKYVCVFQYVNGSNTEIKKLLLRVGKQEDAP